MYLPSYLRLLTGAEHALGESFHLVAAGHAADADVAYMCTTFAHQCQTHAAALTGPIRDRYPASTDSGAEPDRFHPAGLGPARAGPVGLLRDLADLHQLATLVESTADLVGQAAHGLRDRALIDLVADGRAETTAQLGWLRMRMNAEAAQALLAA